MIFVQRRIAGGVAAAAAIVAALALWRAASSAFEAGTVDKPAARYAAPSPQPTAPQSMRQAVPAEVLRVLDGDTLQVRAAIWLDQHVVTLVRLRGVDAPERRARCARESELGEAAARRLEALAAGARLYLVDIGRDKYGGRVVARLIDAGGADLGAALVAEGLALEVRRGRRASWC